MSLILGTLIILPVIAIIGVMPIGEKALGKQGTATYAANATMWNTVASVGSIGLTVIICVAAFIVLFLLIYTVGRAGIK